MKGITQFFSQASPRTGTMNRVRSITIKDIDSWFPAPGSKSAAAGS